MGKFHRSITLIGLLLFAGNLTGQITLPKLITIHDYTWSADDGNFEYSYDLVLKEGKYELVQQLLIEYTYRNEKKDSKRKVIGEVPVSTIYELIESIQQPKDHFTIEDLGYDYAWFKENADEVFKISRKLWEKRWPDSPAWNSQQEEYIRSQLVTPLNISEAVQSRFFNKGYVILSNSVRNSLRLEFHYGDSLKVIEKGSHFRGLPWKREDGTKLFNQRISDCVNRILPENRAFNKILIDEWTSQECLEAIIDRIYQSECESRVKELAYLNYEAELAELKGRFKLWGFKEKGSSTGNWSGEDRLCFFAKDTAETRNIRFRVCLTFEDNSLFTRDSVLKKGAKYLDLVQKIPFLLDYLDEDPNRSLDVSFDNGNSLSEKVKKHQSGEYSWSNSTCLKGMTEAFLDQCVAFVLRDEVGHGSNWIITPELDVILVYYQYPTVFKYSDEDLGLKGPSIRYACQHFDLEGNLKD